MSSERIGLTARAGERGGRTPDRPRPTGDRGLGIEIFEVAAKMSHASPNSVGPHPQPTQGGLPLSARYQGARALPRECRAAF